VKKKKGKKEEEKEKEENQMRNMNEHRNNEKYLLLELMFYEANRQHCCSPFPWTQRRYLCQHSVSRKEDSSQPYRNLGEIKYEGKNLSNG
jgi:hypothetical protein